MDKDSASSRPKSSTASLLPVKPIRDLSSTKLKWNMLLQPSASGTKATIIPTSTVIVGGSSKSTTSTSAWISGTSAKSASDPSTEIRTSSPISMSSGETNLITEQSEMKKNSFDSTTSNASSAVSTSNSSSSSTMESLRSSLGVDWNVVGQPSGATDAPHSGHSPRGRTLSLLERVSGSQLTDNPQDAPEYHSAKLQPRGGNVFSPFESGFDIRVSDDEVPSEIKDKTREGYYSRSSTSSRSSSPSLGTYNLAPPSSQSPSSYNYPSQLNTYAQDSLRRQSMVGDSVDWTNRSSHQHHHHHQEYVVGHRPSLSCNNAYPMRSSMVYHPSARPLATPSHTPIMSAYPAHPSRRSSVPYRPNPGDNYDYSSGALESEMAMMNIHPQDYYYNSAQYYNHAPQHPQYPQYVQQHLHQQQSYLHHPMPTSTPPPSLSYNMYRHVDEYHQRQFYHFSGSLSTPPSSSSSPIDAPLIAGNQSNELSKPAEFHMSSYRGLMYAVEFKAARTEIFYIQEGADGRPVVKVSSGDLVIVEADRGEDLGKVTCSISIERLKQLTSMTADSNGNEDIDSLAATVEPEFAPLLYVKEIVPKRIYRIATPSDLKLLNAKGQEEAIAMVRCQSRIRQKRLPMEVVDAEYQWDRNKLTFYFQSEKRIDFRELVRDLFRIYKTRIWMCAVDKNRMAALTEILKNIPQETIDAVNAAALAEEEEATSLSINDDPVN